MLFFEYGFLFGFLPITLAIYYLLPASSRFRNPWLLLASTFFYAASSFEFLPLLLATITVDYLAGARIAASDRKQVRRAWLLVSLSTNLSLLAYFKYIGLFTSTLNALFGGAVPVLVAALPVGISFYVFQSMSYTIDVYRGQVTRSRSPLDFATFVVLFPQLIAGPIVRYSDVADQLRERAHTYEKAAAGIGLFVIGMAKKLLVADTLASFADPIFASGAPGAVDAWGSMLLYAGQIYFDFSGYSDMAIGLGRLFGFEFPINFNGPYRATSFSDFWRRWHISLSTWLRDYLYISLGGNRRGEARTYANLMITMLLGGLWHGASWNFVLWGAGHGAFLAIERALGATTRIELPWFVRRVLVFLCVVVLWVPFRLEGLDAVGVWLSAMFFGSGGLGGLDPRAVPAIVAFLALVWMPKSSADFSFGRGLMRPVPIIALFLLTLFVGYGRLGQSPFLYFRF